MVETATAASGRIRAGFVTTDPIDVLAVMASVEDDSAGGATVFVGRVRDHDEGRQVTSLTYSAHPAAEELLRSIVTDVATRFDVEAVAAVHRIGELEVGDIAVVVAASAAHRDAAFAGSRALIEEIKAQVPIWKEQFYNDGTNTWVGS